MSRKRRALLCDVGEVKFLAAAGKGVLLMKLAEDDALLAILAARSDRETLVVKTSLGGEQRINTGALQEDGPRRQGPRGHLARRLHRGRPRASARAGTAHA